MRILAFDTTAAACSIALVDDHTVLAHEHLAMAQGQAEALIPLIDEVMAAANLDYSQLDRIAVTVGPGSFTGVRVGLATARALGLAANTPVVGVSTLDVLADAVPDVERARVRTILSAIDTKRGELYVQLYDEHGSAQNAPAALPPPDLSTWVEAETVCVVGDGSSLALPHLKNAFASTADMLPDAVRIARRGAQAIPMPTGPLPLYVLPPKITLAPSGGRLRP